MTIEIKVPTFPESVSDGTLVSWKKKEGDAVERDEVIAEIETDKVVFEVPAMDDGVLSKISEAEGSVVLSGQVIGEIEAVSLEQAEQKVEEMPQPVLQVASGDGVARNVAAPVLGPAAKKAVVENKLDPALLSGTAKDGRVSKEDVIAYVDEKNSAPAMVEAAPLKSVPSEHQVAVTENKSSEKQSIPVVDGRHEKRVPMTRLRARIAERLLESQQTAAILTTFNEIDMQPVMAMRSKYKEQFEKTHDSKLGFMSFFVKATIEALKRFPDVNASIDDKDIMYHGYYDIGIAVGSPRGLVVPVIRDADHLDFAGIERTISDFGKRAQDSALTIDEMTGGTFSITNGGVFGSMLSTPIINPPQSGILGLHKIEKRPVVVDDEIVIRPMMYVALSYDHRLIDGRGAVQFLVTIKELIEDPARLLLAV